MGTLQFHHSFMPMAANPLLFDDTYVEINSKPPLQPFVRCFWGSIKDFNPHSAQLHSGRLINPDACYDLIFIRNNATNKTKMLFTGLYDRTTIDSWNEEEKDVSIFAVRLHFWAIPFFTCSSLNGTLYQTCEAPHFFEDIASISEELFSFNSVHERAAIMESYLSKRMDEKCLSQAFLNCVDFMIKKRGVGTLTELSDLVCYSKRQVQRIFLNSAGITPIRLMNIVRYQFLWHDLLTYRGFDYFSSVLKYGYTDQSHLIADFKKHHGTTPRVALENVLL